MNAICAMLEGVLGAGDGGCVLIPHGSIKKLIGRELSFYDEPVEL